jgi:rod shape-determining protein MreD
MKRLIVIVAALAAALLLQLTFVNGLALPGGGAPDLVLLCIVAVGLVGGPEPGLITGFCAGLALDLAPPANELIGQYALVFCLVGYGCGRMRFTLRRSALLAFAAAAFAALAGELLAACLVLVLDTPQVTLTTVAGVLPSSVLYDLVLSPLVLFSAVKLAVALGVSFSPLDDSPALERGGSAAPVGLAGLGLRRAPNAGLAGLGGDGIAVGSGAWLTGDSAAAVAAVGSVGWLRGPARSRRARREQARLTAALTGAAPRKGDVWVGSRPAGVHFVATPTVVTPSGLHRMRPASGVAGSAKKAGIPAAALPSREPKIDFAHGSSAGTPVAGRVHDGRGPKIAFGTGGLPGSGQMRGRGVPRIDFAHGGLAGTAARRRAGQGVNSPKIEFGTGRPKARRGRPGRPGRPARPKFSAGSPRSASGSWLAASRFRSAGLGGGVSRSYGLTRSNWPRTSRMRRKLRSRRWLRWLR